MDLTLWEVRNTSRKHPHTPPTPRAKSPEPRGDGSSILTLRWTAWHLNSMSLGLHILSKFQPCLFSQTKRYNLFLCNVLGTALCTAPPRHTFPWKFVMLLVSGTFFFSYLRDEWDLHFPLNTKWLCLSFFFFLRISDIWSSSNLFSYLTLSNNWALALAELVSIFSERKSPHCYSLCCRWTGGDGTMVLESLSLVFLDTPRNFFTEAFGLTVEKADFFLVMISPLSGLPLCSIFI